VEAIRRSSALDIELFVLVGLGSSYLAVLFAMVAQYVGGGVS
jgi:hypothetical protein